MFNTIRTLAFHYIAPFFIISSPITSYADQIYSMHKKRSSAGFSLDIPLIMLVASITKVFYWFGDPFDTSLLIQACLMIAVQALLLYIALSTRSLPDPAKDLNTPFAPARAERRPYDFWQWREKRPYFQFLLYWTLTLAAFQVIMGKSTLYITLLGYFALATEATLPLPQIIYNQQNRSCQGFRLSVLINWLVGDLFKMSFFFLSGSNIPWAFKLCGLFQWACDIYLGVQFSQFGAS